MSEYLVSVQSDQTFHYIHKSVSGRGTWSSCSLVRMTPPLRHHSLLQPGNNGFQFLINCEIHFLENYLEKTRLEVRNNKKEGLDLKG